LIWKDRLPKAPLDSNRVQRETGAQTVFDWINLFNGFQAELPEPFAVIDVLEGVGTKEACEALRALRRNPRTVRSASINMGSNRLWNINPILYEIAERTNPGTAIDLGCGAGRDAVWLAANGWEVTAVDRLQTNLDWLKKLRAAYAPNDPIRWVLANLNETKPENQYDLVLLHYCWDQNYFELAKKCVSPGGYLSILAHTHTHRSCFSNPRESKILNPADLDRDGFETIIEREFWSIDRHSASLVLRRL
jgi:SAM-dependent methyltransferase